MSHILLWSCCLYNIEDVDHFFLWVAEHIFPLGSRTYFLLISNIFLFLVDQDIILGPFESSFHFFNLLSTLTKFFNVKYYPMNTNQRFQALFFINCNLFRSFHLWALCSYPCSISSKFIWALWLCHSLNMSHWSDQFFWVITLIFQSKDLLHLESFL